MKNTTKALFAAILSGYQMAASSVIASSTSEATIVEIRAEKDDLTTVQVESNGVEEVIELTGLAESCEHKKMIVINVGDGHVTHAVDDVEALVDFDSVAVEDDSEVQKIVRKHVIVKADDNSVLTGHNDAIIHLIEKGPFSPEELDTIQSALDSKR